MEKERDKRPINVRNVIREKGKGADRYLSLPYLPLLSLSFSPLHPKPVFPGVSKAWVYTFPMLRSGVSTEGEGR